MISGVPPASVPHTGSPALIASTVTRPNASHSLQMKTDMGGGPVASDVVSWPVQGHEILDAQASSKLANWFLIATTDQSQLDVDTGLPGNRDGLDCDVLPLGLSEPTDKHSSHGLARMPLRRRAGWGVDDRVDNARPHRRIDREQRLLHCL